jgi:hypothetical protein
MVFLYSLVCLALATGLFWVGRRALRRQKNWRAYGWMVGGVVALFLAVVFVSVGLYGVVF